MGEKYLRESSDEQGEKKHENTEDLRRQRCRRKDKKKKEKNRKTRVVKDRVFDINLVNK